MKSKLGQHIEYKESYWPEVLDFIPRTHIGNAPMSGVDIWHSYEFSWLDKEGSPESAVLRLIVPSHSERICESKSLKLYLASFSCEKFTTPQVIVETIQRDISKGVNASVDVQLLALEAPELMPSIPRAYCIDGHTLKAPTFDYQPALLRTGTEHREELVYSNHFRSLCPVTEQPDWATVYVLYRGIEILPEDLHRYLVSMRRHKDFHESCCERIFSDITERCQPEQLGVMCCFTRRGGIDINPIRYSSSEFQHKFIRSIRQ